MAALFSCKTGQFAFESDKLKHGVFFHFVIEGLKGKAVNDKGAVTWSRLVEYATEQVSDELPKYVDGGAKQTPHELKSLVGTSPVLLTFDVVPRDVKQPSTGRFRNSTVDCGTSRRGSSRWGPPKRRRWSRSSCWAVHEVTQKQFKTIMGYNPSVFSADGTGKGGVEYDSTPAGGRRPEDKPVKFKVEQ